LLKSCAPAWKERPATDHPSSQSFAPELKTFVVANSSSYSESVNRRQLVVGRETVAARVRLGLNLRSDREAVIDGIVAALRANIEIDGFTLKLPSFGKFEVRHKQGKMRKIPLTGKTQMTADKLKVKFVPLSNFRDLEKWIA
jgi:nucleoid DNA-binding protein